jgi:hypothetical protein
MSDFQVTACAILQLRVPIDTLQLAMSLIEEDELEMLQFI